MALGVVSIFFWSFVISAPVCLAETYQEAPDKSNIEDDKNWIYPDQINRSTQEDFTNLMDLPERNIHEGHLSLSLPIFSDHFPVQVYLDSESAQSAEPGIRSKRHVSGQTHPDKPGLKRVWNEQQLEELFKIILQRNGINIDDFKDFHENTPGFSRNGQDYPKVNQRDGLKVLRLRRAEKNPRKQLQDQNEISEPEFISTDDQNVPTDEASKQLGISLAQSKRKSPIDHQLVNRSDSLKLLRLRRTQVEDPGTNNEKKQKQNLDTTISRVTPSVDQQHWNQISAMLDRLRHRHILYRLSAVRRESTEN